MNTKINKKREEEKDKYIRVFPKKSDGEDGVLRGI